MLVNLLSNPSRTTSLQNLLLQDYYPFTTDQELCDNIRSNNVRHNYGNWYNFSCSTHFEILLKPQNISTMNLGVLYTLDLPSRQKQLKYSGITLKDKNHTEHVDQSDLMTIYPNCKLSPLGKVLFNGITPKSKDCLTSETIWPSDPASYKRYDEVYVMAQFWGDKFFHKMVEDIPRLALFLNFLKTNSQIKILSTDRSQRTRKLLEALGLDGSRLVTGWISAKIAYVPRTTKCGVPNFLEAQILNKVYRDYISANLLVKPIKPSKIILIRRTGLRQLLDHLKVVEALKKVASRYQLDLRVFSDNPTPTLKETMALFAEAVAVVAPHGAGLSNLLFSAPGTLVLEGILKSPNVNLCYQRLAFVLGMRWYGMTSQHSSINFVSLNPEMIASKLNSFLKQTT